MLIIFHIFPSILNFIIIEKSLLLIFCGGWMLILRGGLNKKLNFFNVKNNSIIFSEKIKEKMGTLTILFHKC